MSIPTLATLKVYISQKIIQLSSNLTTNEVVETIFFTSYP